MGASAGRIEDSPDYLAGYWQEEARRAKLALEAARREIERLRALAIDVATTLEVANDPRSASDLSEVVADQVVKLAEGRFVP
jgi:hypothetical protein